MNTAAFLESLRTLTGLSDPMIGYLVDHAEEFSDEQREEIISELKPLNKQSSKLLESIKTMYEKAENKLSKLMRKDLPKIRKEAEAAEHEQEMKDINSNLFS